MEATLSGEQVLDLLGGSSQRRRSVAIKYSLALDVEGSVWLPLVEWACERMYPSATASEQQVLLSALCHAFADNTSSQYVSVFRSFAGFCAQHDPELGCLPASKEAVHLFLADQVASRCVNARSLAGMVSAVNAVHNLSGLPTPVVEDSQHRLFMAGLHRIIEPMGEVSERKPVLCSVVVQALRQLVPLDRPPAASAMTDHLPLVSVVLGMITGLRGSALGSLSKQDLSVSEQSIVIRAVVLKRKFQPRMFADWCIPLNLAADSPMAAGGDIWQRIHRLLAMHLAFRSSWAGSAPLLAPVAGPAARITESTVDGHVVSFIAAFGEGVSSEGFSSHSLRIGAASAMIAAGVSRNIIRIWFRWTTESMIDLYCRVVSSTDAVQRLYGWMVQVGPSFTLYQ
jgi:hypothetical protein